MSKIEQTGQIGQIGQIGQQRHLSLVDFAHYCAHQLGRLRKIQKEQGGLPAAASTILDEVDAHFEALGGDLDERKP